MHLEVHWGRYLCCKDAKNNIRGLCSSMINSQGDSPWYRTTVVYTSSMNAEQLYSVPEINPRAFSFRIGVWWFGIVTVFKDWRGISFRLSNWLESHNLNSLKAPYRSEMLNRSQKRWIDAVSKPFHWHLVEIGQFQDRARHRLLKEDNRPQTKPEYQEVSTFRLLRLNGLRLNGLSTLPEKSEAGGETVLKTVFVFEIWSRALIKTVFVLSKKKT